GFARDMQLPTETLLKGLLADLGAADEGEELAPDDSGEASLVMAYADSRLGRDLARVLAADLAGSRVALPARFAAGLGAARERGGAPAGAGAQPGAGWRARAGASGETWGQWQGSQPPSALELPAELASPLVAALSYDRAAPASGSLPVKVSRRLLRLVPGEAA